MSDSPTSDGWHVPAELAFPPSPVVPSPADEIEMLQQRLAEQAQRTRKAQDARRLATRDARAALLEAARLARSVSAHKAHATRLLGWLEEARQDVGRRDRELSALRGEGAAQLVLQPLIRKWLLSPAPRAGFRLPRRLVVVGQGPLGATEFARTLAALGIEAVAPADPRVEVMVVGRDGWLVDDLEDQVRARGERVTRVYSQEMLLAGRLAKADPLKASAATLKQFAEGHAALQYLIESGFDWPLVTARGLGEGPVDPIDVVQSPLHVLGYVVGRTHGLPERNRHALLRRAFEEGLPFVHSRAYLEGWGPNASRIRLRRMARHVAWLIGLWAQQPSHETAVEHWRADLDWMRATLYEPWMRFRWPTIGAR